MSYLAGGAEVWLQKAEDLSVAENMAAQIARAQTTTLVRCVCNRIFDFFLGCVTIYTERTFFSQFFVIIVWL